MQACLALRAMVSTPASSSPVVSSAFVAPAPSESPPLSGARRAAQRRTRAALAPAAFQVPARKWWEDPRHKAPANVHHVDSVQQLVDRMAAAGDGLVILCKLMAQHPQVTLLCCNFDENHSLVKSLDVKVLPFFHFYRGPQGKVAQFSASASKLRLIEEAIAKYSGSICTLPADPLPVLAEYPTVVPCAPAAQAPATAARAGAGAGRVAAAV
eukprot:scaffold11.g3838.t1